MARRVLETARKNPKDSNNIYNTHSKHIAITMQTLRTKITNDQKRACYDFLLRRWQDLGAHIEYMYEEFGDVKGHLHFHGLIRYDGSLHKLKNKAFNIAFVYAYDLERWRNYASNNFTNRIHEIPFTPTSPLTSPHEGDVLTPDDPPDDDIGIITKRLF